MREPGFYWVRKGDWWSVRLWHAGAWHGWLGWSDRPQCSDTAFDEIDERRLLRQLDGE